MGQGSSDFGEVIEKIGINYSGPAFGENFAGCPSHKTPFETYEIGVNFGNSLYKEYQIKICPKENRGYQLLQSYKK